jgi:hypothetical protein
MLIEVGFSRVRVPRPEKKINETRLIEAPGGEEISIP